MLASGASLRRHRLVVICGVVVVVAAQQRVQEALKAGAQITSPKPLDGGHQVPALSPMQALRDGVSLTKRRSHHKLGDRSQHPLQDGISEDDLVHQPGRKQVQQNAGRWLAGVVMLSQTPVGTGVRIVKLHLHGVLQQIQRSVSPSGGALAPVAHSPSGQTAALHKQPMQLPMPIRLGHGAVEIP